MNKKELEKQNKITIEAFLRNYIEIDNENIIDTLSSLTHKEFKKVCKEIHNLHITSIPFEAVELEDLCMGNIILVYDTCGNIAPYKNPNQKGIIEIHEEIRDYPTPKLSYLDALEEVEFYEAIIDTIEDNLTDETSDISSLGSFKIPVKERKLIRKR